MTSDEPTRPLTCEECVRSPLLRLLDFYVWQDLDGVQSRVYGLKEFIENRMGEVVDAEKMLAGVDLAVDDGMTDYRWFKYDLPPELLKMFNEMEWEELHYVLDLVAEWCCLPSRDYLFGHLALQHGLLMERGSDPDTWYEVHRSLHLNRWASVRVPLEAHGPPGSFGFPDSAKE